MEPILPIVDAALIKVTGVFAFSKKKISQFTDIGYDAMPLSEVSDGTAEMTAYNKLRWSFIGDEERLALRDALLHYWELDTLAMVMLMQGMMALDNPESYDG